MTEIPAMPSPRILVVEDDRLLQRLMTRVLTDAGYEAYSVPNGVEALALLERARGAVDLVVTGVAMPIIDGVELYRTLRQRGHRVPVLFVSSLVPGEDGLDLAHDSRARFLAKPWTLEELQTTVRDILEREAHEARTRDQVSAIFPRPERRGGGQGPSSTD